jgi:hypothetical protein
MPFVALESSLHFEESSKAATKSRNVGSRELGVDLSNWMIDERVVQELNEPVYRPHFPLKLRPDEPGELGCPMSEVRHKDLRETEQLSGSRRNEQRLAQNSRRQCFIDLTFRRIRAKASP